MTLLNKGVLGLKKLSSFFAIFRGKDVSSWVLPVPFFPIIANILLGSSSLLLKSNATSIVSEEYFGLKVYLKLYKLLKSKP